MYLDSGLERLAEALKYRLKDVVKVAAIIEINAKVNHGVISPSRSRSETA